MPDEAGWLLSPGELTLVETKNRANRLGFAILLTFFREQGRFPRDSIEVGADAVRVLAEQLGIPDARADEPTLRGRTAEGSVALAERARFR